MPLYTVLNQFQLESREKNNLTWHRIYQDNEDNKSKAKNLKFHYAQLTSRN